MRIDEIELSKKLISKKSCPPEGKVTPEDNGAIDVLVEALDGIGFKCDKHLIEGEGDPVWNLYAKLEKGKGPHLCFAGHTDVVPTGDLSEWKYDPFTATIEDGILYGRGAVDMKIAICCFISAVSEFLEDGKDYKGTISLLITGDEEADAINGTKKLLEILDRAGEKIDDCIVGEPTNPSELGEMIKIGRRGSVSFDLIVHGKQGHVAYSENADNPVPYLVEILNELNQLELDQGTEYFQTSNVEVTSIATDTNTGNVVPGKASAKFNIRFNDKHKSADLIKQIDHICKKHADEYELKPRLTGESFLTSPGKIAKVLSDAVKDVTGIDPILSTTGGTSDARFIKDYANVIEFGLINKTAHQSNECESVDNINNLKHIYRKVIENYFK